MFPKAFPASQSSSPKKCSPKRFLFPKVLPQNCSPKYLCKANAPKRLCFKYVRQSDSQKLFSKAAPESCCPKVVAESCSPKLYFKASPQSCSSPCSLKLFGGCPKAAMLQMCSPKRFPSKAAPESCSCRKCPPKLRSKANSQSCVFFFKIFVRNCRTKLLLFPKPDPQNYSPKPLLKL